MIERDSLTVIFFQIVILSIALLLLLGFIVGYSVKSHDLEQEKSHELLKITSNINIRTQEDQRIMEIETRNYICDLEIENAILRKEQEYYNYTKQLETQYVAMEVQNEFFMKIIFSENPAVVATLIS